ncbi:hypothetical protein [Lysinibacillus sp. LZ02]|uniref:hypothetical protein n=1 Tax=Lysinibacillus sp. LZ02 TaxID=3420668 RepID=UPI003D363ABF
MRIFNENEIVGGLGELEEIYKVEPIGVKYTCDKCGEGEMLSTGKNNWSANPPQFEHVCSICNHKDYFFEKYPLVRFRTVQM